MDRLSESRWLSARAQLVLLAIALAVLMVGLVKLVEDPQGWGASIAFAGFVLVLVVRWFRTIERSSPQSSEP